MASVKGYLAIISALIFCPCHLPIYAAVFAGTALGASITDHVGLLFPLMAAYFIGALVFGIRWMTRNDERAGCATCEPVATPSRAAPPASIENAEGEPPGGEPKPDRAGRRHPVGGPTWT